MPIKGTYYNATLGAAPSTLAHLGYVINSNLSTSADVAVTTNTSLGYLTVGAGIYLLTIFIGLKYTTAPSLIGIYLGGVSTVQFPFGIPNQNTGSITCNGSLIITKTSNANIDLLVQYFGGSGVTTLANNSFTAVRIG